MTVCTIRVMACLSWPCFLDSTSVDFLDETPTLEAKLCQLSRPCAP